MTGTVLAFPPPRADRQTAGQARRALELAFRDAARREADFLHAAVAATGCGIGTPQAEAALLALVAAHVASQRVLVCTLALAHAGGDVVAAWQDLDGIGTDAPA